MIRDYRKAWKVATQAAGCPGRIPHDFRRTAVRNFMRASVPERVAMRMTGYKTRRFSTATTSCRRETTARPRASSPRSLILP
jgi:hypothetical protein